MRGVLAGRRRDLETLPLKSVALEKHNTIGLEARSLYPKCWKALKGRTGQVPSLGGGRRTVDPSQLP